jgi:hypothetical protein
MKGSRFDIHNPMKEKIYMANLIGNTADPNVAGVEGVNTNGTPAAGVGVHGVSDAAGVFGESKTWHGVVGFSQSTTGGAGVYGKGLANNIAVLGEASSGSGVEGRSQAGPGVFGQSDAVAVWGKSKTWHGVAGETQSGTGGAGVYGKGLRAGVFDGNVDVNGDLKVRGVSVAPEQLSGLVNQVSALQQQISAVQHQITGVQQQVTTLQQLVTNLQQQLANLQQKESADVQGLTISVVTLASRVTAVEQR